MLRCCIGRLPTRGSGRLRGTYLVIGMMRVGRGSGSLIAGKLLVEHCEQGNTSSKRGSRNDRFYPEYSSKETNDR